MNALDLLSRSASDTRALAFALSEVLGPGDVVALTGPLGAGKTTLVRGLTDALQVPADAGVCSPSYALVHLYDGGRWPIAHLDLYRLADSDELEGIGFRDLLDGQCLVLIEWAERVTEALEAATVHIALEDQGPETRNLKITARDASMIQALRLKLPGLAQP